MPAIVTCPECGGKLRVPDDLMGSAVRCPRCNATFSAAGGPNAAPADWPESPLERVADGPAAPAEPDAAFQLKLSLDDESPASPRGAGAPLPRESAPPPRRPRLNDDHDDLKDCPYCGKHLHRDYFRCPHCGEGLSGEDGGARRASFGRRDADPHRGGLVLALGIASLPGMVCPPVGLVLGLFAWILGQSDLGK